MSDLPDIDVPGQLDEVTRRVSAEAPGETTTAMTVEISQEYPTDQADLWQAVTTADRLARWFAPVHGDLELGGRYQVEGNAGGVVQTCEPPERFTATWVMGEGHSLIDVRVEEIDADHSRLRLIHSGDVDNGFWQTYGPGAVGVGWDLSLLGLAGHLVSGAGRPPEADEWAAGEQAREFMRGSAVRWVDAAIAAGLDPDAAREAGGRTTSFYLGE